MLSKLNVIVVTLALAATASLAACKKKPEGDAAKALPPAAGQGAPPPVAMPKLDPVTAPTSKVRGPERATGSVNAKNQAKVGPKMSGVIAKIYVKEGDTVKKGQPLFTQDVSTAGLARRQAQAGLNTAEVNLRATKVEYDRTKLLFDQGAVNKAQMDQLQARYDAAQAMVDQAKVGVAQAGQLMNDATVRSPIDGVVAAKLMSEGEMATMMPPSVVLVVQDPIALELKVRLPESALARVKEGTTLIANFTAIGVTRKVTVTRLAPQIDPQSRTIEVVAEVPNTDGALRAGMLADVTVEDGSAAAKPATEALATPVEAKPGKAVTP